MSKTTNKKRWWEILRGIHSEGKGADSKTFIPNTIDEETLEETQQGDGPYIHTASDLSKLNPPRKSGFVQRFRPMSEGEVRELGLSSPEAPEVKTPLESLTIPRLRIFADKKGLDVSGLSTKAEILAALREANLAAV